MPTVSITPRRALSFEVAGVAQSRGSKQSMVPIDKRTGQPFRDKKTGRVVVSTVDSNAKSKGWMKTVGGRAREAMQAAGLELLDAPLLLKTSISLVRPAGHFGTGRNAQVLKDSAPAYPAGKPDLNKMLRAIEDALTSIVYRDDARIVRHVSGKHYGPTASVLIEVWIYPATVRETRESQKALFTEAHQ